MKKIIGVLLFLVVSFPAQVSAGGTVILFNESEAGNVARPCYRFSDAVDPAAEIWRNFGGVGAGTSFGWNFAAILGLLPGESGTVEFTYVDFFDPVGCPSPGDSIKGNHRTRFEIDSDTNIVLQIGKELRALELEGPNERGR